MRCERVRNDWVKKLGIGTREGEAGGDEEEKQMRLGCSGSGVSLCRRSLYPVTLPNLYDRFASSRCSAGCWARGKTSGSLKRALVFAARGSCVVKRRSAVIIIAAINREGEIYAWASLAECSLRDDHAGDVTITSFLESRWQWTYVTGRCYPCSRKRKPRTNVSFAVLSFIAWSMNECRRRITQHLCIVETVPR